MKKNIRYVLYVIGQLKKQKQQYNMMLTTWKHTSPYQAFTLWSTLLNTTPPPGEPQRTWNADTRKLDLTYVQRVLPRILHPIQQQEDQRKDSEIVHMLLETGGDVHQINRTEHTCGIQLIRENIICKLPTFVLETNDDPREIAVAIRRAGVRRPNVLVIKTPNHNNTVTGHLKQVYCNNSEYFGIIVAVITHSDV